MIPASANTRTIEEMPDVEAKPTNHTGPARRDDHGRGRRHDSTGDLAGDDRLNHCQ